MKLISALLFCLVILVQSGCGSTAHNVSGTVKLDGEPISEGHIAFVTEGGGGGGGAITNGQYTVAVTPGKAKVQITADKMQPLPPGEKGMYGKKEELRSYIPSKYNTETELKADITGPTSNLDFNLKSK